MRGSYALVLAFAGCGFRHGVAGNGTSGPTDSGGPDGDAVMRDSPADGAMVTAKCSDPGLVLCVSFDGSAVDGSPAANQVTASAVTYVSGKSAMAVQVTTTSAIDVAQNASLDPLALTVAAWVKPDPGGAGYVLDNDNEYSLRVTGTSASCLVVGQTGAFPSATAGSVPANTWTHIACTYSAATGLQLYVNAQQVGSAPTDGDLRQLGTIGIAIGRNDPTGTNFSGAIDEVKIWNTVVSPSTFCPNC